MTVREDVSTRVHVRLATEDDDLDALNAGNVQWMGEEQLRRLFTAAPPEDLTVMLVGSVDGEEVGFASAVGAPAAAFGYGLLDVYVQPHARRRGLGRLLAERAVEAVRPSGVPGLMVSVADTEPDGLAAALHCGLVVHGHHIESRLDLTALDDEVVRRETARAAAAGFALDTLPDDADETVWQEAFAFFSDRLKEAPDSRDGGGNMPYPIFRGLSQEPWHVLVARRSDGSLAGITALMVRADAPNRLNTLFTGVHPDACGNGLAAAMKTEHARRCRDRGWVEILTQNMDQNGPILAVNRRLGFEPVTGQQDLGLAL